MIPLTTRFGILANKGNINKAFAILFCNLTSQAIYCNSFTI